MKRGCVWTWRPWARYCEMSQRKRKLRRNWDISFHYDVCAERHEAQEPQGSNHTQCIQCTYCGLQLLDKSFLGPSDGFVIQIVEPVCEHSSFWLCLKVKESRSEAAQLATRTLRHCSLSLPPPCHLCTFFCICPVLLCTLMYSECIKQQGHFL